MNCILTVIIFPDGAGGVQASPYGTYVGPGQVSYPAGTVVNLTALPYISGAYFVRWQDGLTGSANPAAIAMNSDKTVTVVFSVPATQTYRLTTQVTGNGSIYPDEGIYNPGDQIVLTATPSPGNVFKSWGGDTAGASVVPGMPEQLLVTMDRDRLITALFEEAPESVLSDLDFTVPWGEYDLGDTISGSISYRYSGLAQYGQLTVIIGKGAVFSPVYTYSPVAVSFERSDSLVTITRNIDINLPVTLEAGQVYSLKILLETADGKSVDRAKGSQFKIVATAVPEDPGIGQYRIVRDYYYPAADTYKGMAAQVTYEFNVPLGQLEIVGDWISGKVLDAHHDELQNHGSQMLHLQVSEREHGLLSKDYLVTATATSPGEEYPAAMGLPLVWIAIIGVILAAIGFAVSAIIKNQAILQWGPDVIEEPPTWGNLGKDFGALLTLGLMIPMMGIMQEQTRPLYEKPGTPERPKPYTEAALKAARGAVKLAQKGADRLTEEISEIREKKKASNERERRLLKLREEEKQEKLEEALEELRKRRQEQKDIEGWF